LSTGGETSNGTETIALDPWDDEAASRQRGVLPNAPWDNEKLSSEDVPDALLAAWRGAENREWCAPLTIDGLEGADVRRTDYSGGWAVEFDEAGLPGVTSRGRACEACGRGAFGIAGTAMWADDEDPAEAEEHTFRDGSRLRFEPSIDEEAPGQPKGHVASLKIEGQDCLYQVWSFVDDRHLQDLLGGLRFVESE